ncbi:hypothetical protein V5O48_018081 [Marasmius crinis-equi]|uniref:Uncharacterized protein n=1 Tax=Marasmius crinis-equi TaxID=585013 RepID=A0ABR3EM71_9AGAR
MSRSPALHSKAQIEAMLLEYKTIEAEYFYLIRNRAGQVWDKKQAEFMIFSEVALEMVESLDDIQLAVDSGKLEERMAAQSMVYHRYYKF